MKKTIFLLTGICIVLLSAQTYPQNVNFTIVFNDSLAHISPYIYGTNQMLSGDENWTVCRQGGNRMTGYNWENNASNAGNDNLQSSDNYLTSIAGITDENKPGIVTTTFHNKSLELGTYSLVTLQMAGYVAKDKNGTVTLSETAPSPRWAEVRFEKGSPFILAPNPADSFVYMDEYVNFLVTTFGLSNTANGIRGYSLDNEPALWPSTHPRIHPGKPTCQEVIQKAIGLSSAVKKIDGCAEIFGPVLYGFSAYTDFQSASDWITVSQGKNYSWFIDYYLDEMKKAEGSYGKRLLDVLDLHWYPEAKGDHRITENNASSAADKAARIQAPRTLWDAHYIENSWIGQWGQNHLPLIPKLIASINKYYPGTKLAFTEFTYGGENDISGAVATADVLGIFAKYGIYLATLWPLGSNSAYVSAAYRIFRNYDGAKSTFGDFYTPSFTSDSVSTSIYGSVKTESNEIHLVVINKDSSNSKSGTFIIGNIESLLQGTVWILDKSGPQIRNCGEINTIHNNSFSYTLPAQSVCHFILKASKTFAHTSTIESIYPGIELFTYPNPFNSSCTIKYKLPDSSNYKLDIVDMDGRLIKTFYPLTHNGSLIWDGTNDNKQSVASGAYYLLIKGDNHQTLSKKIILLK